MRCGPWPVRQTFSTSPIRSFALTRTWTTSTRLRRAPKIEEQVAIVLEKRQVGRYLKVRRRTREEHRSKQAGPGRPGSATCASQDHPATLRPRVER